MTKRIVGTTVIATALLLFPVSSYGGPVDEAVAAYRRSEFTTAVRLFRELAEQQDPLAETILSEMYLKGQGVVKDESESLKWLQMAAEQGFAPAQTTLGSWYERGIVVEKDLAKAEKWLRLGSQKLPAQTVALSYVQAQQELFNLALHAKNGTLYFLQGERVTGANIEEVSKRYAQRLRILAEVVVSRASTSLEGDYEWQPDVKAQCGIPSSELKAIHVTRDGFKLEIKDHPTLAGWGIAVESTIALVPGSRGKSTGVPPFYLVGSIAGDQVEFNVLGSGQQTSCRIGTIRKLQ